MSLVDIMLEQLAAARRIVDPTCNALTERARMPRYRVVVDDNFHYMESDARWEKGTYETVEEALAACRGIVDQSLTESYEPGFRLKHCTSITSASVMIRSSWCSTVWMTAPNSRPGTTRRSAAARCARSTRAERSEITAKEERELAIIFGKDGGCGGGAVELDDTGWSRALQTRVDSREAPSSLDTGGVEGTPR